MTRIDIEDIRKIESEIDRLNKLDLSQVELYIANEKITIPEKIIADWKFTGLNNYHFFKDEFYLEKPSLLDQLESGPWPSFVSDMKKNSVKFHPNCYHCHNQSAIVGCDYRENDVCDGETKYEPRP